MKKICLDTAAVFLIFCTIISSFMSNGCKRQSKKSGEMSTLKVNFTPITGLGPLFIAQEEGYFKEQGLTVEFVKLGHAAKAMPALMNGDLDVIPAVMTAGFLNAIAKGKNMKVVADRKHTGSKLSTSGFMVRKDLWDSGTVVDVEDFRGKKIGLLSVGGHSDYFMSKVLMRANLTLEDIHVVRGGFPLIMEALKNKSLDAGLLEEPFKTIAQKSEYTVEMIPIHEVFPDDQIAAIMFGPNLLVKNRDLGKRFMVAYLKGVRKFNEGKTDRNVKILHEYTEIDEEILKQCGWDAIHSDGRLKIESLFAFQDWLYENGLVDIKLEEDQFIDMSFVEYANKILESSQE